MTMADYASITEQEAVKLIAAHPLPVMFIDTCNFGNIFRDALDGRSDSAIKQLEWLNDAGAPNGFHLALSVQVIDEYYNHKNFLEPAINRLQTQIECWQSMLKTYGKLKKPVENPYRRNFDVLSASKLYEEIFQEIGAVFTKALILEASATAQQWSRQRQHDFKRPAQRAKNSYGDCEICGTSLSLMKELRNIGFDADAFFVSANTSDYAQDNCLHDDLEGEFDAVRMEYCSTFKHAYGEIRRRCAMNMRGNSGH